MAHLQSLRRERFYKAASLQKIRKSKTLAECSPEFLLGKN